MKSATQSARRPSSRLFWIAAVGLLALVASLVLRANVADRYRRVRAAQRLEQQRLDQIQQAEALARDRENALARLQQAVAASPNDVRLRWILADAYQKLGRLDRAAETLETIGKLDPKSADAWIALGNTRLALAQYPEAVRVYRETAQRWPGNAAAWQGLAVALNRQTRYMEAAAAAGKAMRLQPKDPNHRLVRAVSMLDYTLQFPDSQTHAGDLEYVRKELEQLLKDLPDNGDVHRMLGQTDLILRRSPDAIPHLKRALELLPDRTDVVLALTNAYINTNQNSAARQLLETQLARHPDDAPLQNMYGQLLQTAKDPEDQKKALAAFETAARLQPENAAFQETLGTQYLRAQRLPEARTAFEQAVLHNPNRAYGYQQLAAIYNRLGDVPRSNAAAQMANKMSFNDNQLRQLEQLSAKYPNSPELHYLLGQRYRDLGMHGPARDQFLMVLSLDPGQKHARAELDKLNKSIAAEQAAPPKTP